MLTVVPHKTRTYSIVSQGQSIDGLSYADIQSAISTLTGVPKPEAPGFFITPSSAAKFGPYVSLKVEECEDGKSGYKLTGVRPDGIMENFIQTVSGPHKIEVR